MTVKTYDVAQLVESGYATFYVSDDDRWNGPSISINRDWREPAENLLDNWKFSVSYSSSSSSDKNVDGLLKLDLFRLQLADLADTMRDMMNRVAEFEAAYQVKRAREKAEYEARVAAAQAKKDADTKLTPSQIGHLIATMAVDIKHGGKYKVSVRVRPRGDDVTHRVTARRTCGDAVQFKFRDETVSKAKLATILADYAEIVREEVTA